MRAPHSSKPTGGRLPSKGMWRPMGALLGRPKAALVYREGVNQSPLKNNSSGSKILVRTAACGSATRILSRQAERGSTLHNTIQDRRRRWKSVGKANFHVKDYDKKLERARVTLGKVQL